MTSTDSPMSADYTATGELRPRATLRRAVWVLALCAVAAAALLPVDGAAAEFCRRFRGDGDLTIGGDLRRTLSMLQQFGDVATSVLIGIVIFRLDPPMRRRMLDWVAAALAVSAATHVLKILFGRPRPTRLFNDVYPGYDSALHFVGFWRQYPIPHGVDDGNVEHVWRYSWELWAGIGSDLASMPSSHTSAAAALAVALSRMYPRITGLVWALVVIVGTARVLFGAHYPSDVVAGAGVGYAVAVLAMDGSWGRRLAARAGRGRLH